jgi:hypothetical protein
LFPEPSGGCSTSENKKRAVSPPFAELFRPEKARKTAPIRPPAISRGQRANRQVNAYFLLSDAPHR